MLKRYAVEVYFLGFAAFLLGSLMLTLQAVLEQREASAVAFALLIAGCILGLMAMVAADVRQREAEALPTD